MNKYLVALFCVVSANVAATTEEITSVFVAETTTETTIAQEIVAIEGMTTLEEKKVAMTTETIVNEIVNEDK